MVNSPGTFVGVHPEGEGRRGPARRRRRTPEVAEGEIIAAAESLLRERPFRELTVDEVMRRTDLSRPSFYVYFTDRHQLVLKVVEHLGAELFTMSDRWLRGTGEGPELARAEHGRAAIQCRKCLRWVKTIEMPAASAASTTSWSRTDPPGWMTAVMPASTASCGPSGNGKKASEAIAPPPRSPSLARALSI